ncbi:hypothetical protein Kfla_0008 [Kribbella flavida DSM 17836]|uniref:DUF4352 domain-containing protein n=1 Tax=Kribbella flavida (strain DSM 17836 / JCM 10339 / NBRC 14399) TaxID=479435 RepID=D2PQF2_KRIFD|nr:hypothetical protein [Kribbella flavida]ADB29139.1 hypothetical protein Kfla_0008 [Kribbella flavida DSM 17836]
MRLYRPATVIVGVLFVLLGGVVRLADPDQVFDDSTRVVTEGTVGTDLKYGDSTFTITRVKFARSFVTGTDDKAVTTEGVFVAVEYDAVRGPGKPARTETTLTADGGSVYAPVSQIIASAIDFPEPGFARTGTFVYEVNPSDLAGLTFRAKPTQLFNSLAQELAVDLGVPSEQIAERSVDNAADQYNVQKDSIRVAS